MDADLSHATWRKSSFSGSGGQCIEVADGFPSLMPVRDSKDPQGPVLMFPAGSFAAFVAGVVTGEFGTV